MRRDGEQQLLTLQPAQPLFRTWFLLDLLLDLLLPMLPWLMCSVRTVRLQDLVRLPVLVHMQDLLALRLGSQPTTHQSTS